MPIAYLRTNFKVLKTGYTVAPLDWCFTDAGYQHDLSLQQNKNKATHTEASGGILFSLTLTSRSTTGATFIQPSDNGIIILQKTLVKL